MKVVCISGHAQHGKDTTAQMIRKSLWGYGKKVLIIHNADLLKFMCKQLFGWNGEKDERGRTLLQYVGTDVVRRQRPGFWAGYIVDVLGMFDGQWDCVLIPDCRFPNEVDFLKDSGFEVIHLRVDRPDFDNGLTEEQKSHPSETALDDVTPDFRIINVGSLANLYANAFAFAINHLLNKEECSEESLFIIKR